MVMSMESSSGDPKACSFCGDERTVLNYLFINLLFVMYKIK